MGANRLETFETKVVHRSEVVEADYNPRTITESAKKKLRKFLRTNGLWAPLIWNKQTGNLVSGHQRLTAMDSVLGTSDYELTVSVIDVDEKTEVTGNVFLNNPSAQGDWDYETLGQLHELFPDISYTADFGFDQAEVDLFLKTESEAPVDFPEYENQTSAPGANETKLSEEDAQKFRELKKEGREAAKQANVDGKGYSFVDADYTVSVIFPTSALKKAFMAMLGQPEEERRMLSEVLLEFMEAKQ